MAYIQKDRVKETTTTIGTGAISLLGAVAGFQAFSAVMTAPSDTCYYVIVSATGTDWETGTGTYSSASVLTRTTVLSSSNSGNAVSFAAGTKDVFMGPIANGVNDIAHGGTGATTAADARTNLGVSTGTVTSVSGTGTVSGLSLSGTVTSSGSLTLVGPLDAISLTTGVSGTLPVANGGTGVTTSTGTTNVVLSNSPTLVTPLSNTLSAIPVALGAGNSLTIAAGSGVTSGAGGNVFLISGEQASTGGRGIVLIDGLTVGRSKGTGGNNAVLGVGAMAASSTARYSVAVGDECLAAITTGQYNTAVGAVSMYLTTTGSYNTAVGISSGRNITNGTYNTFLGQNAGYDASQLVSAVNSMALGYGAFTSANNQVVIGNTSVTQTVLRGYVNTTVYTVATLLAAASAATAGAGARAFVSDSNSTTFAAPVAGGGGNGVPVYSDGANWRIG